MIGSNGNLECLWVWSFYGNLHRKDEIPQVQWARGYDAGGEPGFTPPVFGDSWADNFAIFLENVLVACYGSNWQNNSNAKVDVVAHSMGGLVVRAATKWYNLPSGDAVKNRIRKLLMVGTPNHPYNHAFGEWIYELFTDDEDWQKLGEDWEMDVESERAEESVTFKDWETAEEKKWCDHLGYENNGVQMATIAGNKGWKLFSDNDGVVFVQQVKMGSAAQFEPTVYASHSYDEEPEIALTTCTYNEEFIKNWIIDDNISHNGAQLTGAGNLFLWPAPWDSFEVRSHASVDDYNKALVLQSVVFDLWTGEVVISKAFPIYKYSKSIQGKEVGDPVLSKSNFDIDSDIYYAYHFLYDMDHIVASDTPKFAIRQGPSASIEVTKPSVGEVYTVHGAWNKLTVKFKANFHWANIQIYFSPDDGLTLFPVWYASNWSGDGDLKTIELAMPQVNSPCCKILAEARLDNFTTTRYVGDRFTIRIDEPSELYCFDKDESKVGLDWLCGSILNFEVQRKQEFYIVFI